MKHLLIAASVLFLGACNNASVSSNTTGEVKDSIAKDNVKANALKVDTLKPVADTSLNAANPLDVVGKYTGTLPCADCEGIASILELKADKNFVLTEEYLGKKKPLKNVTKGTWIVSGSTLTLQEINKTRKLSYKVEGSNLRQLDMQGKVITGTLADKYILTKK